MSAQIYCPRCGKLGVDADTATDHIVMCVDHGVIHKSPLPQPAVEAAAAPAPEAKPSAGPRALN